jgi:hypothetical protein
LIAMPADQLAARREVAVQRVRQLKHKEVR